jgi:hypothetical protein
MAPHYDRGQALVSEDADGRYRFDPEELCRLCGVRFGDHHEEKVEGHSLTVRLGPEKKPEHVERQEPG